MNKYSQCSSWTTLADIQKASAVVMSVKDLQCTERLIIVLLLSLWPPVELSINVKIVGARVVSGIKWPVLHFHYENKTWKETQSMSSHWHTQYMHKRSYTNTVTPIPPPPFCLITAVRNHQIRSTHLFSPLKKEKKKSSFNDKHRLSDSTSTPRQASLKIHTLLFSLSSSLSNACPLHIQISAFSSPKWQPNTQNTNVLFHLAGPVYSRFPL